MLILNCLINQRRARQTPKASNQRRSELLLEIDVNRVFQSVGDRIVNQLLTCRDHQILTRAIQVNARAPFKHREFDDSAGGDVSQHSCACNSCRNCAHLDFCAAGFLWHIKQKLSAAQFDGSSLATHGKNSFLTQTRDRLILERQLAPGLDAGLHRAALANSLVDRRRTRRCT